MDLLGCRAERPAWQRWRGGGGITGVLMRKPSGGGLNTARPPPLPDCVLEWPNSEFVCTDSGPENTFSVVLGALGEVSDAKMRSEGAPTAAVYGPNRAQ